MKPSFRTHTPSPASIKPKPEYRTSDCQNRSALSFLLTGPGRNLENAGSSPRFKPTPACPIRRQPVKSKSPPAATAQPGRSTGEVSFPIIMPNDFALALRAAESGTPTSRKPESPAAMGWAILSVSSDRIDPSAAVVDIGLDRTRWWRCFRLRSFIDMRTARYEQRQCGKYEGSCVHPFHMIFG